MDACYNVGLSGKLFCFILERGLDRDNDTERQSKKKKKERNGENGSLKVVAFSNDDKHAF